MQFWSTASTRKPKGWGAAACDLNVADLDFSPAQCEADKSVPDKIRQQLQVLSLPDGSCRATFYTEPVELQHPRIPHHRLLQTSLVGRNFRSDIRPPNRSNYSSS